CCWHVCRTNSVLRGNCQNACTCSRHLANETSAPSRHTCCWTARVRGPSKPNSPSAAYPAAGQPQRLPHQCRRTATLPTLLTTRPRRTPGPPPPLPAPPPPPPGPRSPPAPPPPPPPGAPLFFPGRRPAAAPPARAPPAAPHALAPPPPLRTDRAPDRPGPPAPV